MIFDGPTLFKVGDRVRLLMPNGHRGRIVELRGPLAPKGMQVYRIQYRGKPKPGFMEMCEDQIELIPPKGTPPRDFPGAVFQPGSKVRIPHLNQTGRIKECIGRFEPTNALFYRVRLGPKWYTEVREDQLELAPPKAKSKKASA